MIVKRRAAPIPDDACPVLLDGPVPTYGPGASEFLDYCRARFGPGWDYVRTLTRGFDDDRLHPDNDETVREFLAHETAHMKEHTW